mmetsp:Transcript_8028/g.16093  ORF Transcript_8028/g.16093 Transcript_8028/m.16093 type:complete len:200 (-) Transcript_8028:263-862(-)
MCYALHGALSRSHGRDGQPAAVAVPARHLLALPPPRKEGGVLGPDGDPRGLAHVLQVHVRGRGQGLRLEADDHRRHRGCRGQGLPRYGEGDLRPECALAVGRHRRRLPARTDVRTLGHPDPEAHPDAVCRLRPPSPRRRHRRRPRDCAVPVREDSDHCQPQHLDRRRNAPPPQNHHDFGVGVSLCAALSLSLLHGPHPP